MTQTSSQTSSQAVAPDSAARENTTPALVALQRCADYDPARVRESLRAALESLDAAGLIEHGQRILLKPNFLARSTVESATTTHPELIKAVAEWVRDQGATPVVGDSPAFGSAASVAGALGLLPWLRDHHIEVITLRHSRPVTVDLAGERFRMTVSGDVLDADAVINLPKLKAHSQMRMTLGVKNLYGCVAGKRKPVRHTCSRGDLAWFARMLLANERAVRPALTIADGIVAMERTGPRGGDPRNTGILAASTDTLALDLVLVECLNVNPQRIPTLEQAAKKNLGTHSLDQIRIAGESMDELRLEHFQLPEELIPINFSIPHLVRSCWKSFKAAMSSG